MDTLQQQETQAFLDLAEAMRAMEIQLRIANIATQVANERIRQLEAQIYGGSTK
jgi:allophanate hydrolase subunit 1